MKIGLRIWWSLWRRWQSWWGLGLIVFASIGFAHGQTNLLAHGRLYGTTTGIVLSAQTTRMYTEWVEELRRYGGSRREATETERLGMAPVRHLEEVLPRPMEATPTGVTIPILLYHYTPGDFEEQLDYLAQQGYTTVDLDQVQAALHGTALPEKPVVITFDDGFSNQVRAAEILKRHQMKATFYIITSGEASQWCIGSGRRQHDPLQPPQGCGDAYLSWDEVRSLDRGGLITIGAHTVNHRPLATLTPEDQRYEIRESKAELERQLGHSVRHFAYPYGSFDALTANLVAEAGYTTATTTMGGMYQSPGSDFMLLRVRDAWSLP